MRLQRKLKKKIIKVFGRGTYRAIIEGYLTLDKYYGNRGVETVYTDKPNSEGFADYFYHAHQSNPYVTFKKIYNNERKNKV